jgi:uncharacterized membrane protein YoaK (UPF0700 family)
VVPRDTVLPLLILISASTGLIDAISILGLGRVFTANMTGNIVFLGFAIAGAPGFTWEYCSAALVSFLIGAAAGGRLSRADMRGRRSWLLITAGIEACFYLCAAAIGARFDPSQGSTVAMIGLVGASMGLRNATVRQLKIPDLTTTVLTMTITGLAADSRLAGGDSPNFLRRVLAVAAIMVGACIGALLVISTGIVIPLIVAAAGTLIPTITLARDVPAS